MQSNVYDIRVFEYKYKPISYLVIKKLCQYYGEYNAVGTY